MIKISSVFLRITFKDPQNQAVLNKLVREVTALNKEFLTHVKRKLLFELESRGEVAKRKLFHESSGSDTEQPDSPLV